LVERVLDLAGFVSVSVPKRYLKGAADDVTEREAGRVVN
jgi:hypothetical protein